MDKKVIIKFLEYAGLAVAILTNTFKMADKIDQDTKAQRIEKGE